MDRNADLVNLPGKMSSVALRKESVDRNTYCIDNVAAPHNVALRKESVDRNRDIEWKIVATYKSLSARRAWIEIPNRIYFCAIC